MAERINESRKNDSVSDLVNKVIQIGLAVDDLDAYIANMKEVFGIEPDSVQVMNYPSVRYRGEGVDSKARVASFRQFGVELEFMEPMGEDSSAWKDHLLQGNTSALHHIRFNDIEKADEITQAMADLGIGIYQDGDSVVNPGGKFIYFDTLEKLGFISEVVTKR